MRRFFRIHLSTGIVLMLLASTFLGLNLYWFERPIKEDACVLRWRGWPWKYLHEVKPSEPDAVYNEIVTTVSPNGSIHQAQAAQIEEKARRFETIQFFIQLRNQSWLQKVAANVCVLLVIMALVAVLLERRLRKRAA